MHAIIALLYAAIQWESRIVIAIMIRAIVNILFLHIFVIISTTNKLQSAFVELIESFQTKKGHRK